MITLFGSIVSVVSFVLIVFMLFIKYWPKSKEEKEIENDIVNAQVTAHAKRNKRRHVYKQQNLGFLYRQLSNERNPAEKRVLQNIIDDLIVQKKLKGFISEDDFAYFGYDRYIAKKDEITFIFKGPDSKQLEVLFGVPGASSTLSKKVVFHANKLDDAVKKADEVLREKWTGVYCGK